jgi:hypothetical protein
VVPAGFRTDFATVPRAVIDRVALQRHEVHLASADDRVAGHPLDELLCQPPRPVRGLRGR